jgi:hypothetical protein
MTPDLKRRILASLVGILVLTVVIAAALPQLELKPGIPLPGQDAVARSKLQSDALPLMAISVDAFWKAVLGILLLASLAYGSYKLLRGAKWNWRSVLKALLAVTTTTLVIVVIVLILARIRITVETPPEEARIPILMEKGPPLGPLPSGLIWLVWLGLAAGLAGFGLWLVFRSPAPPRPDLLKLEAEHALEALKTGLDLRNVIVHCYWQMAQVLQQEQGIEKGAAMTVREFERLLGARGVPPTPVHQLTQLFEAARYGQRSSTPDDEHQAVDCLTAIVHFSQAGRSSR